MKAFSDEELQKFLTDLHVGVLSVATSDGRPPASVPIWYDYVDGLIRINTGSSSRKARLIREAGALSLVVQREEPPYQYVTVEGSVVDTLDPAPRDIAETIAISYLGDEGGRAFVAAMEDSHSVIFLVRPDRWITADFSDEL